MTPQEKEHFKNKIENPILFELIDLFSNELKLYAGANYENCRQFEFSNADDNHILINLSNWENNYKENLFMSAMKGINYFTFVMNNKTVFPIGAFNSVMKAIDGNDDIYINKKAIKWFPQELKSLITQQGIEFEDLKKLEKRNYQNYSNNHYHNSNNWLEDVAGTNDPETMNDVYWNLD